ncbi:hypothetical protein BDR05DRAFT_1055114 [Suillus weaverae]|nr:hypothetical protein BDR05DRAFT_1055114 [Suillus weaverae]
MPPSVAVMGTCDTKLEALLFLKCTVQSTVVCDAILIDIRSYHPSGLWDIDIPRSDALRERTTNHSLNAASGTSTLNSEYREATQKLKELGYSVITFHATGVGGLAMERLVREGHVVGVLDTITELSKVWYSTSGVCGSLGYVTLMRTSREECSKLGQIIVEKLKGAKSDLPCSVEELDVDISDPSFASRVAQALHELLQADRQ